MNVCIYDPYVCMHDMYAWYVCIYVCVCICIRMYACMYDLFVCMHCSMYICMHDLLLISSFMEMRQPPAQLDDHFPTNWPTLYCTNLVQYTRTWKLNPQLGAESRKAVVVCWGLTGRCAIGRWAKFTEISLSVLPIMVEKPCFRIDSAHYRG